MRRQLLFIWRRIFFLSLRFSDQIVQIVFRKPFVGVYSNAIIDFIVDFHRKWDSFVEACNVKWQFFVCKKKIPMKWIYNENPNCNKI